jgi:hypothetical protein
LDRENHEANVEQIGRILSMEAEDSPAMAVENPILLARALAWLADNEFVHILEDAFGPTMIVKAESFSSAYDLERSVSGSLFWKFHTLRRGAAWLSEALERVNELARGFELTSGDFEALEDEWKPLPIEVDPAERTTGAGTYSPVGNIGDTWRVEE